jgi:hypothetical protein
VAVSFKIRICQLLTEFLANAFVFFRFFAAAGAVSTVFGKALPDSGYHFGIFI